MSSPDVPRARDALGAPVPPPFVTAAVLGLRNWLDRVSDQVLTPPSQLLIERLMGLVDAKTLGCAVLLDLADHLEGGPLEVEALAARSGAEPDALDRILRYLVSRGFFRSDGPRRYANNPGSDILRRGHPYSWRPFVEFLAADWYVEIWNHMIDRLRGARSATEAAFGVGFFEYVNRVNPAAGEAFNGAMGIASRIQAMLLAERVDLAGVNTICDVGGGSGSVATHLLRAHPHLSATVLDLPDLADRARRTFEEAGVADRATFVGGDFFEAVPPGFDRYMLFAVIHDWDDAACLAILGRVREGMPPGGRVLVVEKPIPPGDGSDFAKASDMMMLVLAGGARERTEPGYEALFGRAGLRVVRRTTLPSLYRVFELAR